MSESKEMDLAEELCQRLIADSTQLLELVRTAWQVQNGLDFCAVEAAYNTLVEVMRYE